MSGPASGQSTGQEQYLTFELGAEHYGIDILRLQEIKGWAGATPIPGAPAHVKGVMDLRGAVVPVVDLRVRFGMPAADCGPFSVVIVARVGQQVLGLLVDAVSDVLDVAAADVQQAPDLGSFVDVGFIRGIARSADRLVVLLDLDRVLEAGELAAAAGEARSAPPAAP